MFNQLLLLFLNYARYKRGDAYKEWGEYEDDKPTLSVEINGHQVTDVHIEQAYKGNFHLCAKIDGREKKFVISKNKNEFSLIESLGIANLTEKQLLTMVEKFLCK